MTGDRSAPINGTEDGDGFVRRRGVHGRPGRVTTLRCRDLAVEVPGRRVLTNVQLDLAAGTSLAVVGPSGAGKLNVLAGIVSATAGTVKIAGTELGCLRGARRARFRLDHIGIVFQFGELLPEFSVAENVALPLRFRGIDRHQATANALEVLEEVGMRDRADDLPDELSGGERQRVAVARALAGHPSVILADEPTGSLDRANAGVVAELLVRTTRSAPAALLLATHDPLVAARCDRVIELRDGSFDAARTPC
jgi:ABC-type lipoprotein export system ATPase subunit